MTSTTAPITTAPRPDGLPDSRAIRAGRHILALAMLCVCALLPFEAGGVQIGPLTMTWLEWALCGAAGGELLLLGFGDSWVAGRSGLWLLAFIAAGWLSAALAPNLSGEALRGSLRLTLDALVGLAALRALIRPVPWLRPKRLMGVLLAAAAVSAGLGIVDQQGSEGGWLTLFADKATLWGSVRRLTATFAHANIAAAFFACMLPIGLTLARRHSSAWLGVVLIGWALLGTYSRGAWIAAGVGLLATGAMIAVHKEFQQPGGRKFAMIAGLVVLSGLGGRLATDAALRHRSGLASESPQVSVQISVPSLTTTSAPVTLINTGWVRWRAGGSDPFQLLATGMNADHQSVDERRTRLPHAVGPGERVTVMANVPKGDYVRWALQQHGKGRFEPTKVTVSTTTKAALLRLQTAPAKPPATTSRNGAALPGSNEPKAATRADLWAIAIAQWRERPLVGWGANTFRLRWPDARPDLRSDTRMHANSLYLELLADLGLLGLLAWCGAMGTAVMTGLGGRGRWKLGRPGLGRPGLAQAGALLIVVACIHGLVDCVLFFHGTATLVWLGWALAMARVQGDFAGMPAPDRAK
ncbi:MAG: O-antigen ligase family protein [Myxococcales bacterium]|nr:O-antigen ligase family protein [Myxococcales bacterium]